MYDDEGVACPEIQVDNDGPFKAILVVMATALACSILVTGTAVKLQPIQLAYQNLERIRYLVGISGLTDKAEVLPDRRVISLFQALDARIVNLESGQFEQNRDAATFDTWSTIDDPEFSVTIPAVADWAKLDRRSRLSTIFLVQDDSTLKRMILPIYGKGMWSTLYGYIALETDLNTIADITFYQQAETAGIGDRILSPEWQAGWRGRRLYDETGTLLFQIGTGPVDSNALAGVYQVDAITGATVTVDAVADMVRYWFGPHGFAPFLASVREQGMR